MANIDKLRKEVAATKDDMLSGMNPADMGAYIFNLLTDYYYSYVNDDMDKFHTADEDLAAALQVAYKECNNAATYINYCRIAILTGLMNKLFKRDAALKMPDTEEIHEVNKPMSKEQLDKVYEDRYRDFMASILKEMKDEDEYFKNLEVEMMAAGDYVKHLIRPDVDADFINSNISVMESILTDEGMTVLKQYMNDKNHERSNDL